MDIEALDELLGKYLLPLVTTDWKQFLLSALPSIVTVVTIISSSILQSRAAKREMDRLIAQNEHALKLEKEREEAAQRSTLLNKQIDEIHSQYAKMLELYYPITDALCDLALNRNVEQACFTMRSNATKLLCLSTFCSVLESSTQNLIDYLDSDVIPNISNASSCIKDLRWRVKSLGSAISDKTLRQAMLEGTIQTEIQSR